MQKIQTIILCVCTSDKFRKLITEYIVVNLVLAGNHCIHQIVNQIKKEDSSQFVKNKIKKYKRHLKERERKKRRKEDRNKETKQSDLTAEIESEKRNRNKSYSYK